MQTSTGLEGLPKRTKVLDDETNASTMPIMEYYFKLPQNINIFSDIDLMVKEIEDNKIREYVKEFIDIFKYKIYELNRIIEIDNNLPKLRMEKMEDEAVLIHWSYKHFRIGFAFEKNIKESSYYIVADNQITGSYISKSELLERDNFELIITQSLGFVREST